MNTKIDNTSARPLTQQHYWQFQADNRIQIWHSQKVSKSNIQLLLWRRQGIILINKPPKWILPPLGDLDEGGFEGSTTDGEMLDCCVEAYNGGPEPLNESYLPAWEGVRWRGI